MTERDRPRRHTSARERLRNTEEHTREQLRHTEQRAREAAHDAVPALITRGARDDPAGVVTCTIIGATTGT